MNIGSVSAITLTENSTRIDIDIEENITIPAGSTAVVRSVGFLGDKFIEIVRAKGSNEVIKPGGLIPPSTDSKDINEIIGIMGGIATDIKKVTNNLAFVLGSEKGKNSIANIVENIEGLTKSINDISTNNKNDIRVIVQNIRDVTESLNAVINEDSEEKLASVISNLEETLSEFSGASRNINLITEKIQQGEGTVGRLINDEDTVDELDGALRDIRTALAPINDMKIVVNTWGEIHSTNTTAAYFNLRFQTRPSTYYLIGFTDAGEEVKDVILTEEVQDDGSTRIVEKNAPKIRYVSIYSWLSAGVGSELGVGLFETTFGAASDMYFFRDRLRLTAEVYDFNSVTDRDEDIRSMGRLKAFASLLFYDHIYLMIGADDLTRYTSPGSGNIDSIDYFYGGGLVFNDDDLRTLFGLAAVASTTY